MLFPRIFAASLMTMAIAAANAQAFDAQQLGDRELSCQAIYDEIKQMDALIASHAPGQAQAANPVAKEAGGLLAQVARETRSSEAAQLGGFLQRIAGGSAPDAQQIESNRAQTRASADARKRHLTRLFNDNKCRVSTLRK